MASFHATPPDAFPAVDDPLIEPGAYEMYDGELVEMSPARFIHGEMHAQIMALIGTHVRPEFKVCIDGLMRVSATSEIAPDIAVLPRGKDPRTGGRQLTHLVFEVRCAESMAHATRRAIMLVRRGVRRVFVIDVKRARALEWSPARKAWDLLDPVGYIEDPALGAPLAIEKLLHETNVQDAMAHALLVKQTPMLETALAEQAQAGKQRGLAEGKRRGLAEGKRRGLAEGAARGKAEALIVLLTARGIVVRAADRKRILGERDPARLDRWIARAVTCVDVAELLVES